MYSIWTFRGRIVLALVGLFLVIAPIVGARVLIAGHTDDLARQEVQSIATDGVDRAERAIDAALQALAELTRLGAVDCSTDDISTMRRVVYASYLIKEISVFDGDGVVLCNHVGIEVFLGRLSPPYFSSDNVSLQLVQMADTEEVGILVLSVLSADQSVGAVIPSEAIGSNLLPKDLGRSAVAELFFADGTPITGKQQHANHPAGSEAPGTVEADHASDRFPVMMHVAAPLPVFEQRNADLMTYAHVGGAFASTLIFALFLYVLRGPPADVADIKEGIARNEFIPYYQPVVEIGSGRVTGCEVLARRRRSDGTVVGPATFISVAEGSGLTEQMTVRLMRTARDELSETFGRRPDLTIAFNLSSSHFTSLRIVGAVARTFRNSAIAPSQLVFEITERQPLADLKRARTVIRRLQSLGARLALDDAGAGHAGLAHMQQLGVDIVKIDKLFIDAIKAETDTAPIVESMIRLGHDLGMEVVAEGVETPAQLEVLHRLGADKAQGYLFSRPLPASAFIAYLGAEPAPAGVESEPGADRDSRS